MWVMGVPMGRGVAKTWWGQDRSPRGFFIPIYDILKLRVYFMKNIIINFFNCLSPSPGKMSVDDHDLYFNEYNFANLLLILKKVDLFRTMVDYCCKWEVGKVGYIR